MCLKVLRGIFVKRYTWHIIGVKNKCLQGRIQDLKLGGAIKQIAPSGGRLENVWGISCEKSRFYAKKIIFFPILGGCAPGAPPFGSAPGLCLALTIHACT